MASVSSAGSSDSGYNYYRDVLTELQDEIKSEAKRSRDLDDERLAKMESSYKEATQKNEKATEETVETIRQHSNSLIDQERKQAKEDIAKNEADLYNRFGRARKDLDSAREQVVQNQRETEVIIGKEQEQRKKAESHYSNQLEQQTAKTAEDVAKAAAAARDAAYVSMGKMSDLDKDEYATMKSAMQARFEEAARNQATDLDNLRRANARTQEDLTLDYQHKKEANERLTDQRLRSRAESNDVKLIEGQRRTQQTFDDQNATLRDQVNSMARAEAAYRKDLNKGKEEAVRDYEMEWHDKLNSMNEAFGRQIEGMGRHQERGEEHLALNFRDMMRNKEDVNAAILRKNTEENHSQLVDLEKGFLREYGTLERQNKLDKEQSERQRESLNTNAELRLASAMEHQADANQQTVTRQRAELTDTINVLEKQLNNKKVSQDTSDVSPAIEAKIRNTVLMSQDKILKEEQARNKRSQESIMEQYSAKMHGAIEEKDATWGRELQNSVAARHADQQTFLEHVFDTETQKEAEIKSREYQHDRERDRQLKNYTQTLDKQRRNYEDILEAARADASIKLQSIRQQAEFDTKMNQRAFVLRENELIRDFDRKLADQKQEYESRLDFQKTESMQQIRETERRTKQAMDEQARSYEQKIAQTESQQKERERIVLQNHQDEVEKMKRSYALLAQKKS